MSSGGPRASRNPIGEIAMTGAAGPSSGGPLSRPSAGGNAACAACKYQRRKCATDCPLAPYFPPDQPKRFLNVHRLFGVSSILRILRQVDPEKHEDTVKSIVYEADTREKDPVNGCLGIIHLLKSQVNKHRDELAFVRDQLYLLEQQHTSSILQQTYEFQHARGQANCHYHPLQPHCASTSHQGSFHDAVPEQLITYQDSRASNAAYHDHVRYLVIDQDLAFQDVLAQHKKVEIRDPHSKNYMDGLRYVSDSRGSFYVHENQSQQNLHQEGSSYALVGGVERRSTVYNPLADTHGGRHVDHPRSVAPVQVFDTLTSSVHSPHVADAELQNAGVHLSLTNQFSM